MRIAILSFHYAEYSYLLARALAGTHRVLLFLCQNNMMKEIGEKREQWAERNLTVIALPHFGLRHINMPSNTISILRSLKLFSPNVVHIQEVARDYLLLAMPRLSRFPCVLTVHDHIPHSGAREKLRARIYKKYLRKSVDAIIVHGISIAKDCEQLFPELADKIFAVRHGILGVSSHSYNTDWEMGTALFFGRMERYKGLEIFIRAIKMINKGGRRNDIKGIIAGTGPYLKECRKRLLRDSQFEIIDKYIPPTQVPELFKRANVVTLPYLDATQSGIAAYALAYGRPMIASNVGALPEIVIDGYNGILVPPGNAYALAVALKSLINDQKCCRRMAQNSFNLGINEFSWESIAMETVKVYRMALLRKKRSSKGMRL